VYQTLTDN